MGNCGFALAPCPPDEREWFARCLTAVEDIPLEAMLAGIDWQWETFPEYLATVERLPKALNYGAYIGHSALRMYVMGKRALTEPATEDDVARMVAAVKEAVRAGAMGFSSSRAGTHVTPDDTPVASRIAEWSEIDALVGAMAELDAGIFQVGPDVSSGPRQRDVSGAIAPGGLEFGTAGDVRHDLDPAGRGAEFVSLSVGLSGSLRCRRGPDVRPDDDEVDQCDLRTEVVSAVRCVAGMACLARMPLAEQKRRMADPAVRARLVADEARMKPRDNVFQGGGAATTDPRKPDYGNLFAMKDVAWEDPTVAALARERGNIRWRSCSI